jgi:hypothetical protein
MPVNHSRRHPRDERGFSMFIVIMAMFVTTMFVAAAFAATDSGLHLTVENKQRKSGYAAAEAGLGYYLKRLREDPDLWTQCASASAPNSTEPSPINQQWDGAGTDPRKWRKIPGVNAEYTIELLHTKNYTQCETTANKQDSMVDMSTGEFRVRITGRASEDHTAKRSIIVTFKREGFLKFVYFTDQENRDPQAAPLQSDRTSQQAKCVDKDRTARQGQGCVEIQFANNDAINGPLHTNDESVLVCGSPTFGRETLKSGGVGKTDVIEVTGTAPGYLANPSDSSCGATPRIFTPSDPPKFTTGAKQLKLPQSNQALAAVAETGGKAYTGKTIIRLKRTTMDVTNYATGSAVTSTAPWPDNGVIYVKNGTGGCTGEIPTEADYDESSSCGNVYVSGIYERPLTIAAANDVIIRPTDSAKLANKSTDANITLGDSSDATLGLIANNFVRVVHRVVRSGSSCTGNYNGTDEPALTNVRIDAAIMSLQHSFTVDNYNCGKSGSLTVNGAIVQKYRGAVGTGSGATVTSGYLKDYWYDDRLRFRSPPYFLDPLEASWETVNSQEQVPAT